MDLSRAVWRKASDSGNGELRGGRGQPARRGRRPRLKDPHGPALTFTPADWHAFTTRLRCGDPGPAALR